MKGARALALCAVNLVLITSIMWVDSDLLKHVLEASEGSYFRASLLKKRLVREKSGPHLEQK